MLMLNMQNVKNINLEKEDEKKIKQFKIDKAVQN